MASAVHRVWAIDIGSSSLKALCLRQGEEALEVVGFDYIEHSMLLSTSGLSEEEKTLIIAASLRQFTERNDVGKDEVAISVAGHNSFARFIKLPPVDAKGIPKIVQYEAVQQIPFDINEVEWDWQLMEKPDSEDKEVGIFAIKNEVISGLMNHFSKENLKVSCVQIGPMALYNYALYDRNDIGGSNDKATVILDMGADNTTLVVCTKSGVWQRNIRIGGNTFTEAIADTFKLRFRKAEKLKRTAPVSKHARQLFTAMKPVFTDLGTEVQRSLGFYNTGGGGKDRGIARIIALGGGMKLRGVAKYLQQTLGIPVIKPDSFERLKVSSELSSAKFHENVLDFSVVYGLAVQMLGQGNIESNLLPRKLARAMAWTSKSKYFTVAAGVLLAVAILSFARANYDMGRYKSNESIRQQITEVAGVGNKAQANLKKQIGMNRPFEERINKEMALFKYRDVIPLLNQTIISCLPNAQNNTSQAELYDAFDAGDVATVVSFDRSERRQLFITSISVDYADSLEKAKFDAKKKRKKTTPKTQDFSRMPFGGGRFMPGPGGMLDGRGMPGFGDFNINTRRTKSKKDKDKDKDSNDGPGFLVVIEGYSPYKNLIELIDPVFDAGDQSKWGFVTRLANLEKLEKIIGPSSFELFEKDNTEHFEREDGDVGDDETPFGIGVEKTIERIPRKEKDTTGDNNRSPRRTLAKSVMSLGQDRVTSEKVLIDPMTSEPLGMTLNLVTQEDIDNNPDEWTDRDLGRKRYAPNGKPEYIIRDHWFRIKAKFLWKDDPSVTSSKPKKKAGRGSSSTRSNTTTNNRK